MKNNSTKKSGVETRDQYTVVLEDIRSQVGGVAEGVKMLSEKLGREMKEVKEEIAETNRKMDRGFKEVNEKFGEVDKKFDAVDKRFDGVDKRFSKVDENLRLMRTEISLIRHNQITRDEFKALEDRVFTIENKLAK